MTQGVSRQSEFGNPPWVGIGIVVVPYKQDRSKYISQCYRSRQVNLLLETGTVAVKCNVSEEAIQNIKFPENERKLGSQVIYVTERHNQTPYVIGVLSKIKNRESLQEDGFNFSKDNGISRVNVIGRVDGELILSVDGKESLINIKASGKNNKIKIKGETIEINSSLETSIKSTSSIKSTILNDLGKAEVSLDITKEGLKYSDIEGNVFEINKQNGVIKMFQGTEPLVKGTELKKQLDLLNIQMQTLIEAISLAPVVGGDGGLSFKTSIVAAISSLINADFSNINSKKTFTK